MTYSDSGCCSCDRCLAETAPTRKHLSNGWVRDTFIDPWTTLEVIKDGVANAAEHTDDYAEPITKLCPHCQGAGCSACMVSCDVHYTAFGMDWGSHNVIPIPPIEWDRSKPIISVKNNLDTPIPARSLVLVRREPKPDEPLVIDTHSYGPLQFDGDKDYIEGVNTHAEATAEAGQETSQGREVSTEVQDPR